MKKTGVLSEIKSFLEGFNNDVKYLVNVETDPNNNIAECIIHEPNCEPRIECMTYEPFMYMKDLKKNGVNLYKGSSDTMIHSKQVKYGVKIIKLRTGNQKRLTDGYCYKLTSKYSYNSIINYLRDGGIDPYTKKIDEYGHFEKNIMGEYIYPYRDLFYSVKTTEQFLISRGIRLYKGFEEYNDIHKFTFDIETTGLKYKISRIIAIGVRDNKGFETILEPDKLNDDESEARLIQDFFNLINILKPDVIGGYNSEAFDFDFILGRAGILKMDLNSLPTAFKEDKHLFRKSNMTLKYGSNTDKYVGTIMWGYSIIDILFAAKRTAAINSEIKSLNLKYIAKTENIAKPNRTYIKGEDNTIGKYYNEDKIFLKDDINNYIQIPEEYQNVSYELYKLQENKNHNIIGIYEYKKLRIEYLNSNPKFIDWFRNEALPKNLNIFISGKNLVRQYLLDDLWETEQVDETYNQSSFLLAKLIPTTYQRVCTMGTASVWNLLLTAWSYENDIAVPIPDERMKFSGGLSRCFKVGFCKRIIKIDYAMLYPSIQLSMDVFPNFDITGVIERILYYLTRTRNIYKKSANDDKLNEEEILLFEELDPNNYKKYINDEVTSKDRSKFKIKQLPIKILNNALFGALGSSISFNWSDNTCARRITCTGRLHLRHAIDYFTKFGCIPLLAVTDGINFSYPEKSNIRIKEDGTITNETEEQDIDEMWKFDNQTGIDALIEKYNSDIDNKAKTVSSRRNFTKVDNDGKSLACLNLSRNNYAILTTKKDKKTGEVKEKIKLTGGTIKSKVMPEYIEEFVDKGLDMILHGKGKEFVDYYYDYCDNIILMRIPLKKIASKSRVKSSIKEYLKRGKDKNGRDKAKQAHMELLIESRNKLAEELFEKHKDSLNLPQRKKELSIEEKTKLISNYMPPEPEIDSVIYHVNCGYKKSHGDSRIIKDKDTGLDRYCAVIVDNKELSDNPNKTGKYNYEKYLSAFNERIKVLLYGFKPEIRDKLIVKIGKDNKVIKQSFTREDLELGFYDLDSVEETMYLEPMETKFWNDTGYNPNLIWDGFKVHEDDKIYYEIYDNALNYLNQKMIEANKPKIKSVNEEYGKGDYILIKNGKEYNLAVHNGLYLEIIRENIQIPKSDIELEFERKQKEIEDKINKIKTIDIKVDDQTISDSENDIKSLNEKYIKGFKKKYNISSNLSWDEIMKIDGAELAFNDYVEDQEYSENNDYEDAIEIDF